MGRCGRRRAARREGRHFSKSGTSLATPAKPGRLLGYDLYFPDFGTTSKGALRFAPEGGGTRVTWSPSAARVTAQ